jgi:putative phosphoribosyl transferase
MPGRQSAGGGHVGSDFSLLGERRPHHRHRSLRFLRSVSGKDDESTAEIHIEFGDTRHRFQDRRQAGRDLARHLEHLRPDDPIVLALPRGGVPVGYEVASALSARFDVLVARKVGAPGHREYGIGAVSELGGETVNRDAVAQLGLSGADWHDLVERERGEMTSRIRRFRGDRPLPALTGESVIVVDDGLATGVTAEAALEGVASQRPSRVTLAVPVGAADAAARLSRIADEVVCPHRPDPFTAVGAWYEQFDQTSDGEVIGLLEQARPREGT